MNDSTTPTDEPKGCTLSDLIALTLGSALAASLYLHSFWHDPGTVGGRVAPYWFVWGSYAIEIIEKSCVGLIPVLLLRSWRYAHPIRPMTYPAILIGLTAIFHSIYSWPVLGILYKDPIHNTTNVNLAAYQLWNFSRLAIGLLAGFLVFIRRKKKPDWLSGLLVALAWSCLAEFVEIQYRDWFNHLITSQGWAFTTVRLLSTILVQVPMGLLLYLPTGLALVDLGSPDSRQRFWPDWASIGLILALLLLYEIRNFAVFLIASRLDWSSTLRLAGTVSSFGLAYLLARIFEPLWRRFLEGPRVNPALEPR